MKLEQAARQALEALELFGTDDMAYIKSEKAITALREALAKQAEQEPVAYHVTAGCRVSDGMQVVFDSGTKLYAAPVRTKDLTDDEILRAVGITDPQGCIKHSEFIGDARAVIAADREKNK